MQFTDRDGRVWTIEENGTGGVGFGAPPEHDNHAYVAFRSAGERHTAALPLGWQKRPERFQSWLDEARRRVTP